VTRAPDQRHEERTAIRQRVGAWPARRPCWKAQRATASACWSRASANSAPPQGVSSPRRSASSTIASTPSNSRTWPTATRAISATPVSITNWRLIANSAAVRRSRWRASSACSRKRTVKVLTSSATTSITRNVTT
jgi:hypothetical protein